MTYTIPSYAVYPGSVYQPPSNPYVLDQIGGVVGCWSTRQLMASGNGNVIRGRDATTNEADYTSAAYPAGIVTLANGGNAFAPAVYDQSGNGNDATQTTAANQPKLVDTGALITSAVGMPVMDFDGADDFLTLDAQLSFSGDFSAFFYVKFDDTGVHYLFSGPSLNDRMYLETALSRVVLISSGEFDQLIFSTPLTISTWYSITISRLSGVVSLYLNGVTQGVSLVNTGTVLVNYFSSSFASTSFNGGLGHAIAFNKALTASQALQLHTALAL